MKHTTRKLLYFSGCAMALGLVLAAAAYFGGAQVSGVSFGPDGAHVADSADAAPQTLTREFPEGFHSLDLNLESGNVELVSSDRPGVEIKSYGSEVFSCSAEDGTLKITGSYAHRVVWMNFDFGTQQRSTVRIMIPKNTSMKNLKLLMQDGNAVLSNFSAENTDIRNQYGTIRLSDASCGTVSIDLGNGSGTLKNLRTSALTYRNDYGNSSLTNISVSGPQKASVSAGNGKISVQGFTAASLDMTDSYGNIELNGMKLSRLDCSTENGSLNLSDSTVETAGLTSSYGAIRTSGLNSGGLTVKGENGRISLAGTLKGKNDVSSEYGSIDITTTLPQNRYALGLSTEYGSVTVGGTKLKGSLLQTGKAENQLNVSGENGNISVEFGK